jgi:ubiquinol-cytochrome c reductase iron-sulfur subunit
MIASLKAAEPRLSDPNSKASEQPKYAQNEYRSEKPEIMVMEGVCTHLGCSPVPKFTPGAEPFESNWQGGFYCPCHGSLFDLAGRVYRNKPAPENLQVPPYKFLSDAKILIGVDSEGA